MTTLVVFGILWFVLSAVVLAAFIRYQPARVWMGNQPTYLHLAFFALNAPAVTCLFVYHWLDTLFLDYLPYAAGYLAGRVAESYRRGRTG